MEFIIFGWVGLIGFGLVVVLSLVILLLGRGWDSLQTFIGGVTILLVIMFSYSLVMIFLTMAGVIGR